MPLFSGGQATIGFTPIGRQARMAAKRCMISKRNAAVIAAP